MNDEDLKNLQLTIQTLQAVVDLEKQKMMTSKVVQLHIPPSDVVKKILELGQRLLEKAGES